MLRADAKMAAGDDVDMDVQKHYVLEQVGGGRGSSSAVTARSDAEFARLAEHERAAVTLASVDRKKLQFNALKAYL